MFLSLDNVEFCWLARQGDAQTDPSRPSARLPSTSVSSQWILIQYITYHFCRLTKTLIFVCVCFILTLWLLGHSNWSQNSMVVFLMWIVLTVSSASVCHVISEDLGIKIALHYYTMIDSPFFSEQSNDRMRFLPAIQEVPMNYHTLVNTFR